MRLFDLLFNIKYTRNYWNTKEYIFRDDSGYFTKIDGEKRETWTPKVDDLSADDWEFFEKGDF